MHAYKRIVCLAVGLVIILIYGSVCELIIDLEMPFYQNLAKADIKHPTTYVLLLFFINCLMSFVLGESLIDKEYRVYLIFWLMFFSARLLSIISMYILQDIYLSYIFSFMTAGICLNMLFVYIKNTKYRGFAMLPVAIWHIYLFLYNYYILILN